MEEKQYFKQKRYVAFLDILGFSNFIESNNIENVKSALDKFLALNLYKTGDKINLFPKNKFDIFQHKNINFLLLSDSIILYTDNDTLDDFYNIVKITSKLLLNGLKHKFPLRGAITYGELFVNDEEKTSQKNVLQQLYGKALVKAYKLEGTQNWSGCIIDNEITYRIPNKMLKYNVPLKICDKEYYVVNWIEDKNSISKNEIERAFYKDETKVSDSVKIKFCNTLKFYEWIIEIFEAQK